MPVTSQDDIDAFERWVRKLIKLGKNATPANLNHLKGYIESAEIFLEDKDE